MDVSRIFEQVIGLINTNGLLVALILLVICAIGEFGFSIPYLLETVWLIAGHQFSQGKLFPSTLLLLLAGTSLGRELGAIILYYLSRYGSMPLIRFYHRRFEKKIADKDSLLQKAARGLAHLSPFTVAMGRLMWLRIPLTLTLGAERQIKTLIIAVLLAAVAWDGAYIILGATIGATVVANPVNMVFIAMVGLSFLYGATFLVRRIRKYVAARKIEN